jgi:hypothetical protein
MTGPVGKHFIIPGNSQNRDLILTATGTAITQHIPQHRTKRKEN